MEASSGQRDGTPFQRYLRGCPQAECTDLQESKGFQWASKCCTCSEQLAHAGHRAGSRWTQSRHLGEGQRSGWKGQQGPVNQGLKSQKHGLLVYSVLFSLMHTLSQEGKLLSNRWSSSHLCLQLLEELRLITVE